ncbi:hypothetical protein VE01_00680 [Pseudogymnoascus verrucosus]|uniref:Wax synthase domain-containing protein n=1 Tax=Pseudogymnoascus verrucosus TaxID=342668 RepID=A0A2P2SWJ9_9PEZI|nr:uncharacterized protein VE01_00680 [Pseudogymnoascus verrucosus]OBU01223.2 hypothetical protein VE01_00680 [Pseudogymnoascus verrucosus]
MSPTIILFTYLLLCGNASSQELPLANTNTSTPDASHVDVEARQGWTSQDNKRGTLQIIWSCAFTMFLCSWSVLCLNVPGPTDSRFKVFRRKVYITALAFLGPEFIFQIALGQFVSARHSVQDFHAAGYTQWTMMHAFYADMGGFILHSTDWVPFPIDAKQLHYLVTEGYIKFPEIKRARISDKNKVDGILRIITVCQILWFAADMAGRVSQHLAITCGELTTAAFIVCSLGTTLCWLHKPADVAIPEIIHMEARISDILLKAGDLACEPYSRTPLDFISRKEWPWSLYWSNWLNILRNLGLVVGQQERPINRFENTRVHELPGACHYIFFAMTAIYCGIFFCGWNYSFPTNTELILWRASVGTILATLVSYWAVTEFAFTIYPVFKRRFSLDSPVTISPKRAPPEDEATILRWLISKMRYVAACARNNSYPHDPAMRLPLKAILPLYVIGVFYCHARTYIFLADIIQLRSLPASAYDTVDWIQALPHF